MLGALLHVLGVLGGVVALGDDRAPAPFDLERALMALSAPEAQQRERAEEWLARHVDTSDFERLLASCRAGSWESSLRLRNALARAQGGLELCVRLARTQEERARFVGRSAIVERVARWSAAWVAPPEPRAEVLRGLTGRFGQWLVLDARAASGRVDLALDQLARLAAGAPPLVLEPELELTARPALAEPPLEGPFDSVLSRLARAHDLDVIGFGFSPDADESAQGAGFAGARFVVLTSEQTELARNAAERIADWCLAADGDERLARRRATARALGACGWPDGVRWMAERWKAERIARADKAPDLVWLDGVLTAAGRGAIDALLFERGEQAWLESYLADRSREPRPELWTERALAIARALAATGRRDLDGGDLLELAPLPADDAKDDVTTWLRLFVWEGYASLGERELAALDERIEALGARGEPARAWLLEQALRTRAALHARGRTLTLERPEALFARASAVGTLSALGRRLRDANVAPPARWADAAQLPEAMSNAERIELVRWQLARGEDEAASRGITALLGGRDPQLLELATSLRTASREQGRDVLARALERCRAGARGQRAVDLSLALGLEAELPDDRLACESSDLAALRVGRAAAAGSTVMREALLAVVRKPELMERGIAGLEWAIEAARAALDERSERALIQAVRAALRDLPAAAAARLRPDVWPPAAQPRATVLSEIDHELPEQRR